MDPTLTDAEWHSIQSIPEVDLVDAAIDLDIPVPARVDPRELVARIAAGLLERARRDGLPLSKWDREDLESLDAAARAALGRACNVPSGAVDALLKAGERADAAWKRKSPKAESALLVPTLLPVLARLAAGR
jgi:hypothetical protein